MDRPPVPPALAELRSRLGELALSDQRRIRRRIDGADRIRKPAALRAVVEQIGADIDAAERRLASRRARLPRIGYPDELPITARVDELRAAIRDHQVVIVAGETGSGKTTQLPKICLELGRGIRGMIGHTQPRRLAARAVADRIAEELDSTLGDLIGYQVRFNAQVGEHTLVKLMTDGILLAELAQDRLLSRYDTLIIDEAHERSLNIDFILGYLNQLLPRRPDLRVVITSATIDPQRFSRHFGDAPVIEVSGRTYPVELRYRPIEAPESGADTRDQIQAISDAVDELCGQEPVAESPGDILVFLSGEREIRDNAEALGRQGRPDTEIVPLYARLSIAEQHRVFAPHPGRRIVLATNVAETSLTVPGIKYVIDPGTARISRYSNRLKVQRLPIEPVSRASANQRAGRCGRLSDGICIRLYSEEDFAERPEFTEPEILRTNLASVILQMAALDLGDVAEFPFIDPPDRRHVRDGVELLLELGALALTTQTGTERLTPVGRRLAQLPIDPRLGRMVLAAADSGCVREVLVIAAALSIHDPRERPLDAQQAADTMHARFAAPDSDFLSYLNLWNYLAERQKELSGNQFRRLCRTEFLNYLRVREWQDLEAQLRQAAASLGVTRNTAPAEPAHVHTALLAGLLSHIGLYDVERRDYLGARAARFGISPGSVLFKKSPRWVMAAELVETTRLWGRVAARIDPGWIEPLAPHLVKRSYSEPHWDGARGAVMAYERVLLYGVPIVAERRVGYGRIDPVLSRELFIRHALVEGDWDTHHRFFHDNLALIAEVEELEQRARRRDILVGADELFDFYDKRIGPDVVSGRHFDSWWKKVRRSQPELLTFDPAMLVNVEAAGVDLAAYPDEWPYGPLPLRLSYQFEPGAGADGVTAEVPLDALGQVAADGASLFEWQVPGLREELVIALIRTLPKALRRHFVPVPDTARAVLAEMRPEDGPLVDVLAYRLQRFAGTPVPPDAIDLGRVPDHLRMTFRVVDEAGEPLGEGKDLATLAARLRQQASSAVAAAAGGIERRGLRSWDFDALPPVVELPRDGYTVTAYPSLVDEMDGVAIRLVNTPEEQAAATWAGIRRLLQLGVPAPITYVSNRLSNRTKLILAANPHGSIAGLLDDCLGAAIDLIIGDFGGIAVDRAGFERLREQVRVELNPSLLAVLGRVERVLAGSREVDQALGAVSGSAALEPSLADVRDQLAGLIYPGFVTATGYRRLADLPRYLTAAARRLERLPAGAALDRELTAQIRHAEAEFDQLRAELPPGRRRDDDVTEIRWMIEELRVSYFAQGLGTAYPISDKRIYRAIDRILDE